MSCACQNKKLASELERISQLARKMAIIERCVYEVRKHENGTYSFNQTGYGAKGKIVEYRHYL